MVHASNSFVYYLRTATVKTGINDATQIEYCAVHRMSYGICPFVPFELNGKGPWWHGGVVGTGG